MYCFCFFVQAFNITHYGNFVRTFVLYYGFIDISLYLEGTFNKLLQETFFGIKTFHIHIRTSAVKQPVAPKQRAIGAVNINCKKSSQIPTSINSLKLFQNYFHFYIIPLNNLWRFRMFRLLTKNYIVHRTFLFCNSQELAVFPCVFNVFWLLLIFLSNESKSFKYQSLFV